MLRAVHIEVIKRGEEAPGINALAQFSMVHEDHQRGLVLTVNYARHIAGPTCCPSGPLAAFRTHRRFHFQDGRHDQILNLSQWKRRLFGRPRTRQASRGAWGRVSRGVIASWFAKGKKALK